MKRVCDESRISNKHFINGLSFKLNIKQNKIRLPKTSLLLHRFKVPCSQSIGSKNSKFSTDAIKYLSVKVDKTEKLFMAQILKLSHFEGRGGEKAHIRNYTFLARHTFPDPPLLPGIQKWEGNHRFGEVCSRLGAYPQTSSCHVFFRNIER